MAMPVAHELQDPPDPAYPLSTPPDAQYPGQTREPLAPPLDEIATPSMWSRLANPLERTLVEIWQTLGLLERSRPTGWVSIHYGRIALNAHAWERMRARVAGSVPDPNLVEPAQGFVAGLPERFEALRARLRGGRLDRRLDRAAERASARSNGCRARSRRPRPGELARADRRTPGRRSCCPGWAIACQLVATESDACLRAASHSSSAAGSSSGCGSRRGAPWARPRRWPI
jgi:hypothetical protein